MLMNYSRRDNESLKPVHSLITKENGIISYGDRGNKVGIGLNRNIIIQYMSRDKFKTETVYRDAKVQFFNTEKCIDVCIRSDGEYAWSDEELFVLDIFSFDMDKAFVDKVRDSYTQKELYEEYKNRIGRYVKDESQMIYVEEFTKDLYFIGKDHNGIEHKLYYKDVYECADEICKRIEI